MVMGSALVVGLLCACSEDVAPVAKDPLKTFAEPVALLAQSATETFGTASLAILGQPSGKPSATHLASAGKSSGNTIATLLVDVARGTITRVAVCTSPPCPADVIATGLAAPARAEPVDWDDDGDIDIVVATLGTLQTVQHTKGSVQLLRNVGSTDGPAKYVAEPLLQGLARTACAVPADLDGDGDLDLLVCEFGHVKGGLRMAERTATGLKLRTLLDGAGTNTAHALDIDGDGDLDVVAQLSQEREEVVLLRNLGDDGDGDDDALIGTFGPPDTVDDNPAALWLQARKNGTFARFELPGAPRQPVAHRIVDWDGDGVADVLFGSLPMAGYAPGAARLVWLRGLPAATR